MSPKYRDVCISLVNAAMDDVSKNLRIAEDPNNYQPRAVEALRKLLDVYAKTKSELFSL